MGKKLNTLTQEQAQKIWNGRPKLPEKKILTFAHKQVFVNEQYFFKHKEYGHRYGYCTACGKDVQIDIENMRLWTDKHAACRSARHNDTVCCPACGHKVQIKDAKRGRNGLCNTAVIAVAQRTRNGGILLSFVRVYEDYTHDFKAVPKMGRLLYAAYFNLNKHFVAKQQYGGGLYISVKSKPTRQLPCTVEPVKLNHNNWKCTQGEGAKLLGFEEALEKSNIRYLPWEAYHECAQQLHRSAIANYPVNLLGLLYQYSRYPVLTERLIKESNGDLVAEQVEWNCTAGLDYKQVVPYKAMRLTKPEYRILKTQDNICCSILKATKALKKYGCKMTDENVRFFLAFQHSWSQQKCYKAFDVLRQHLSPQKAINYVNRQAAGEYGTPTNVLSDYSDYLDQCRRLGLDVNRKEVAVPQDLRDLHRQYSEELTRRANEKKIKEQAKRTKKLAKDLPKLKRKYAYANSGLFIRPAEGPEDLLKEGCAQHNCVYSCYTEQYLDRKTDILFVRKQSDPDQSYVTVEFKNGAVIQCRADHNRPAPPDVQEFMQAWLAHLKSNRKAKAVS
ncbi:MAG: hypothetical protein EGR79_00500 [Ruminococcaceae bacterium]|nr:hypothetical protein [Oscillospiraceae bacterium]